MCNVFLKTTDVVLELRKPNLRALKLVEAEHKKACGILLCETMHVNRKMKIRGRIRTAGGVRPRTLRT